MVKIFAYLIFIVLLVLTTFFGLGPAIFADGSETERIYTLIIVLAIYTVLVLIFSYFRRRFPK